MIVMTTMAMTDDGGHDDEKDENEDADGNDDYSIMVMTTMVKITS